MFRCLIVAAVSTVAQADDKASIPEQLRSCRELCETRGWRIVKEIAIPGHSRSYSWLHEIVRDSLEYADLVATIESGTVDLVVCRDYDRLWRTDALRAQLTTLCREHHAQIFSLNQPVEPVSPENLDTSDTSRLAEILFGWVSEQENRTRQRRRRVGMTERIRRGLHTASKVPYGYSSDGDGALVPVESQARWVRWMFERRAENWGYRRIATGLNRFGLNGPGGDHWRDSTVRYILLNDVYVGRVHWGGESNQGIHQPLVSDGLWQRTRAIRRGRSPERGSQAHHALTGLVRCGFCGWGMVYSRNKGRHYTRCNRYLHSGGRECRSNMVAAARVEEYVMAQVTEAINDPEAHAVLREQESERAGVDQELLAIRGQLTAAESAWKRWSGLFEAGGLGSDELLSHRRRLSAQTDTLRLREHELAVRESALQATQDQLYTLQELVATLPELSPERLRTLYSTLIRSVSLRKHEEPVIEWL